MRGEATRFSIASETDPLRIFRRWWEEAQGAGLEEPTAVALATADGAGRPSVRMVLIKQWDSRGFTFYTNLESRKAADLAANPQAALCFYWMPLGKQVRIEGRVEPVDEAEADAYFATRPREAQIGAWASKQSRPLTRRLELERQVAKYAVRFAVGRVPRPPFWSGFRLLPERIEFWHKRPHRLHDRLVYERAGGGWRVAKLYP